MYGEGDCSEFDYCSRHGSCVDGLCDRPLTRTLALILTLALTLTIALALALALALTLTRCDCHLGFRGLACDAEVRCRYMNLA